MLIWKGEIFPPEFVNRWPEQLTVFELGAFGDNPHYHSVFACENLVADVQYIKRHTTRKNQYSFEKVRNVRALDIYLTKNPLKPPPQFHTQTLDLAPFISEFRKNQRTDTKKKEETFTQYVLNNYVKIYHGSVEELNDFIDEYLLRCFKQKSQLLTKISYKRLRQTLVAYNHNDLIPESWKIKE